MVEYFRRRAIVAAIVVGAIALAGIFVLNADAEYLFDGLTSRGLPLVILSGLCGSGSLLRLVRENHRGARLLAVGAVATVVWGWGVAQWPYLIPETMEIGEAAAPSGTLTAVLVVFVAAAVLILPSLGLLYVLDQKSLLDSSDISDAAEPAAGDQPSPGV
jgi:cytochrome d ubiquinol oxidase subunit II